MPLMLRGALGTAFARLLGTALASGTRNRRDPT
jgi:hypothetical protein